MLLLNLFAVIYVLFIRFYFIVSDEISESRFPLAINTWAFKNATTAAWNVLSKGGSALDALVEGCATCEREQCDGTVGYGGSPDENGETTLDAMIMDGSNMNMGAVANLREIKDAIAVARHVLEYTRHSILAGNQATEFAVQMGFKKESLSTEKSASLWRNWKSGNCQPNFWQNVLPDPKKHCGPYKPHVKYLKEKSNSDIELFSEHSHDTIGMITIDKNGHMFAGTSTNGAIHKIPGRVGDSPIPGAGAYANNEYGAASATGDGDVMMRFLPSFEAVNYLKLGFSVKEAAQKAIKSIIRYYPNFFGGIIVVDKNGEYSASCTGMKRFPFSVYRNNYIDAQVEYVDCIN